MITAILLGFLGLFLGIVGLRCTNIGGPVLSRKAKLAAVAGALHILAGNCGKVMGGPCAVLGGKGCPSATDSGVLCHLQLPLMALASPFPLR